MWSQHFQFVRVGYQEFIIVLTVAFILFGHKVPSFMRWIARNLLR